jgi:hypothetical protein
MLIKDMFQNKQWSNVIKLNSIMGAKRNGSEWKFEISVVDQSVSLSCINNMTICHPRFVNYLPFTIPGDLRCQVLSHLINKRGQRKKGILRENEFDICFISTYGISMHRA